MKTILSSKKLLVFLIVMVCMFGMIACAAQEEEVKYDLIPMVMVDGVIYADTGYTGTYKSNDTRMTERSPRPLQVMRLRQKMINPTSEQASNIGTARRRAQSRSI